MSLDVYPFPATPEFYLEVKLGNVPGYSFVQKFGRNPAVGTSIVPISIGSSYPTLQPAAATTLRVKAGNVADTAAGAGARAVFIQGLDETGALVSEVLDTAGTSASSVSSDTYIRLFRAYVDDSGTYGTVTTGSHTADIVIENGAGGTDWLTIDSTDYPRGQSEVACYSIPLGYTGYVTYVTASVDATKSIDVVMMKREDILDAAAPYQAMREVKQWTGLSSAVDVHTTAPLGPFPALTDIIFLAKAAVASSAVVVEFEILLIAD